MHFCTILHREAGFKLNEELLGNGNEIFENGMRLGITTGSCAAAASYAAAKALLGEKNEVLRVKTEVGITLEFEILNLNVNGDVASAEVKKFAGDDPDVTDGVIIGARVKKRTDDKIVIDGGEGVGTITRKGLFGEVGEKAINPYPRKMITDLLKDLGGFDVTIYVLDGEEIAKKTYNENMGIVGGISIIGTTGIIHPMSEKALLDTIKLEINMVKDEYGKENILLVPGNYGKSVKEKLKLDIPAVEMSNYIGDSLKMCYNSGFRKITLLGHVGKFSKLALGIFNTHSNVCDTRMEAFLVYLFKMNVKREDILEIIDSNTAEIAMNKAIDMGYLDVIKNMEQGAEEKIKKYLKDDNLDIKVIIYSMERGAII